MSQYRDPQTGRVYNLQRTPRPQPTPNLPELLTTAELGQLLRVQAQAIRRRIARGDIKAIKPLGSGRWCIPRAEALRLLKGGNDG